jgi:hypothetical protein
MRHRSCTPRRLLRATNSFAAVAAVTVVALLLAPAAADDRDLLRFDSAKPYLFIVLDTSASMGMRMGVDEWAPGGADGPDSRFYQAKQALFNVLRDIDDVHFGFAGFNQDGVHAVAKHWLYYNDQPLPAEWPLDFPREDLVDVDGDGSVLTQLIAINPVDQDGNEIPVTGVQIKDTRVTEIGGDLITFGPRLDAPTPDGNGRVVAGACTSPFDLADPVQRAAVQSLPVNASGAKTWFWVRQGNRTYLLTIERPGNRPEKDGVEPPNSKVGEDNLHTIFDLKRVASGNSSCGTVDSTVFDNNFGSSGTLRMRLDLRQDPLLSQFFHVNHPTWMAGKGTEAALPYWHGKDVRSETGFEKHPHTGFGWDGNYDSGVITGDANIDSGVTDDDFRRANGALLQPDQRLKPILQTELNPSGTFVSTLGRAFDRGDVIPFDWQSQHRHEVLRRLDPEYDPDFSTLGDFRIARHFGDAQVDGALPRLVADRVPMVAADLSPLGRALTDVRCWYLGSGGQGGNKCKESDTIFSGGRFSDAWSQVACTKDASFGCRRNFLILISDGEDNVAGQNASGSVGNLKNSANMVTWALNVGHPRGCDNSSQSELKSIVTAGGGECINVPTQAQLRHSLESLLGQIRTTARSFASAAVPSVQATVEQKIFLTSFLPFNETSVWKGSVHAFVKPLPVSPAGIPLSEKKCDGSGAISVDDPTQGCHLWDAGQLLLEKQYPASGNDYLALDDIALRRVFYARQMEENQEGEWPRNMRLLDPIHIATENSQPVRFDLWRGLKIPFELDETDPTVNALAETRANSVVDFILKVKDGVERSTDVDPPLEVNHTFLLGDIFHSTPVVIGTPSNNLFFATDLYGNGTACDENDGTASANPGYRCFFEKQQLRRKMLLVGSNDGMLHAFDAGMFRTGNNAKDHWTGSDLVDEVLSPHGSFDNGTGKELFGYVPRMVLPTLRDMSLSKRHAYNVDGTVTVTDAFIDPVRQDATTFPREIDREWRTVVVGGLREGGRGYFGLDITQPDPVVEHADLGFVPSTADSGANDPDSGDFVPVCTASLTEASGTAGLIAPPSEAGCGPVPFPAVLWEFTDSHYQNGKHYFADEERTEIQSGDTVIETVSGNSHPDLGDTWSTPSTGRIRLCRTGGTACDPTPAVAGDDADLIDVFVAVVGGGMDEFNKDHDWRSGPPTEFKATGNWLYMIDLETGEPIYKQPLEGAAPSEPAAVDTNGDGYLDRIYIGTLAGALYRVDLGPIVVAGNDALPALEGQLVRYVDKDGLTPDEPVFRSRLLPHVWKPVKLFDANFDGALPSARQRPIYQRPSVIFQAGSGQYVLAFGTGDRHDLWSVDVLPEPTEERFYVFVDTFKSTAAITSPLTEADLTPIDPDLTGTINTNLLDTGGWVMRLSPRERVITDAFALSGVMVFSSFIPRTEDGDGNETIIGCDDPNKTELKICSKQGLSHVYVVNATNANGLLYDGEGDDPIRYNVAPTFVTNPFAEPGQSRQAGSGGADDYTADDLSVNMMRVMETLKELFPAACKFANYRVDIKTVAADTSLQFIAPVPVCLIERNWKEF